MFYKAALVTSMTGMFSGNPTQRLTETTAMVTRMSTPGSMRDVAHSGGGALTAVVTSVTVPDTAAAYTWSSACTTVS